jgi:carbamoyl-phosphate synthase small subunit
MTRGLNIIVVPPQTLAEAILASRPDGVVLSNGPGDPKVYVEVIETTRKLVESRVPMMGICLGCQILALALGGETYKLKFGHRGQYHPCIEVDGKRCYITSQNHGFAIEAESLVGTGLKVILINANDRTVEGIRHSSLPVFAVQFHPEASPGPNDTNFLFDTFLEEVRKAGKARTAPLQILDPQPVRALHIAGLEAEDQRTRSRLWMTLPSRRRS